MPVTEELPLTQLPDSFLEAVALHLAQYSIGFLRIEDTPRGQDAFLLGSGTLVTVGTTHAILTAHHVLQVLPKSGRLGLILSPTIHQHTIDTQALVYKEIARGTVDSEGPDLGAVILAPSIAAAIAARKTFYNLDSRRVQLLETPPDRHDGVWFVHGFVNDRTVEERGRAVRLTCCSRRPRLLCVPGELRRAPCCTDQFRRYEWWRFVASPSHPRSGGKRSSQDISPFWGSLLPGGDYRYSMWRQMSRPVQRVQGRV